MRLILCPDCDALTNYRIHPATDEETTEHVRRVRGTLICSCLCDWCNCPLNPGSQAIAVTAWRSSTRFLRWEHQYLKSSITEPDGEG